MSTNTECIFIQDKKGDWYLMLQDEGLFGPFKSEEETDKYLSNNFANPGGYFTEVGQKTPTKADYESWNDTCSENDDLDSEDDDED